MIVGFTGTQDGMTVAQTNTANQLLFGLLAVAFHHGDCIGADAQMHDIVRAHAGRMIQNIRIYVHPPIKPDKRAFRIGDYNYNPKDYIPRNHDIVNASDVLIAAPKSREEVTRSGTWATVRYARKIRRTIYIVYPDGDVLKENPQ